MLDLQLNLLCVNYSPEKDGKSHNRHKHLYCELEKVHIHSVIYNIYRKYVDTPSVLVR